jgi:hypothetical protein
MFRATFALFLCGYAAANGRVQNENVSLSCSWPGHCEGASCKTENDCSDDLICINGLCGGGAPSSEIHGYWWWTWSNSKSAPTGTNMGIAFSGYADPNKAVSDSASLKGKLPNVKYIDIGGGDKSGRWSSGQLNSVTSSIQSGAFAGYGGICFDIEEGDSGLANAFKSSFSAAKAKGMKVLVTISNSAPYGIPDAASLMRSFFPNGDIDFLSPQLYETGEEGSNSYVTSAGVQWSEYAAAKAAVIPSIVRASYYSSAKSYFAGKGVTTKGYIQWQQV